MRAVKKKKKKKEKKKKRAESMERTKWQTLQRKKVYNTKHRPIKPDKLNSPH